MESFKKFSNCFVTCFPSPRSRGQLWSRKLPMMRSGLVVSEILEVFLGRYSNRLSVIGCYRLIFFPPISSLGEGFATQQALPCAREPERGRIWEDLDRSVVGWRWKCGQAMLPCQALRAFRRCLHTILCDERVLDIVGASENFRGRNYELAEKFQSLITNWWNM